MFLHALTVSSVFCRAASRSERLLEGCMKCTRAAAFLPTLGLAHRLPSVPADRRRRRSWPRRTTAAPARSGRGWPACATSTPRPANRRRTSPGCDPSSSPSNRPLWSARDGQRRPRERLPLNVTLTPDPAAPPPTTTTITLYTNTLSYDT